MLEDDGGTILSIVNCLEGYEVGKQADRESLQNRVEEQKRWDRSDDRVSF